MSAYTTTLGGLGLCMVLALCACRPLVPEAGVSQIIYDQQRLRVGSNPRGEWFVVVPQQGEDAPEDPMYVVIDSQGQRELFYARRFGLRSIEILNISPVSDQWLIQAQDDPDVRFEWLESLDALPALSDTIGVVSTRGVRWSGPVLPGTYVGTHWALNPPKTHKDWVPSTLVRDVFTVEIPSDSNNSSVLSTWPKGQVLKRRLPGIAVLHGAWQQDKDALRAFVEQDERMGDVRAKGTTLFKTQNTATTPAVALPYDRWAFINDEVSLGADVAIRKTARRGGMAYSAHGSVLQSVGQQGTASLLVDPLHTSSRYLLPRLLRASYALKRGWPMLAWSQLPSRGIMVQKVDVARWRKAELLGLAGYGILMRKGLRDGKTHWQAPDRLYAALAEYNTGGWARAELEARAAIKGFEPWSAKARRLGTARASALLGLSLARQGKLKEAWPQTRLAVRLYVATDDPLHAAQVELDAARVAFELNAYDDAFGFVRRARSRFYFGKATASVVDAELLAAHMHRALGQLSAARGFATAALARAKFLKSKGLIIESRVMLLMIERDLDPMRSPRLGLEEAFEVALSLRDATSAVTSAAALVEYSAMGSDQRLAQLRAALNLGVGHAARGGFSQDVAQAFMLMCAYGTFGDGVSLNSDVLVEPSVKRCERVSARTSVDTSMLTLWTRHMRTQLLSGQGARAKRLSHALGVHMNALTPEARESLDPLTLAHAMSIQDVANGVDLPGERARALLATRLDPLGLGLAYANLARLLGEGPWSRATTDTWTQALGAAARAKQGPLWSELLLEWGLSVSGTLPAPLRAHLSKPAPSSLGPRARLVHQGRSNALQSKPVTLPTSGLLSGLDHMDVRALEAHVAMKQFDFARVRARLGQLDALERGLDASLASSPRGVRLRGQVMALRARALAHQGHLSKAWTQAQRAVQTLASDDSRASVLARVGAVEIMGLYASDAPQRHAVKLELKRLTAPDRQSPHRLQEVLGWRAQARLSFDSGELITSLLAMSQLTTLGYAIEPQGDVYGCGQLQQQYWKGERTQALSQLGLCLQKSPQHTPELTLFGVLQGQNQSFVQKLASLRQLIASPIQSKLTHVMASEVLDYLSVTATSAQERSARIASLSQKAAALPSLDTILPWCTFAMQERALEEAQQCLSVLEKNLAQNDPRRSPVLLRLHVGRTNRILDVGSILGLSIPSMPKEKGLWTSGAAGKRIVKRESLLRAHLMLRQELFFSALLSGQRGRALKYVNQSIMLARTMPDKAAEARLRAYKLKLLTPFTF